MNLEERKARHQIREGRAATLAPPATVWARAAWSARLVQGHCSLTLCGRSSTESGNTASRVDAGLRRRPQRVRPATAAAGGYRRSTRRRSQRRRHRCRSDGPPPARRVERDPSRRPGLVWVLPWRASTPEASGGSNMCHCVRPRQRLPRSRLAHMRYGTGPRTAIRPTRLQGRERDGCVDSARACRPERRLGIWSSPVAVVRRVRQEVVIVARGPDSSWGTR